MAFDQTADDTDSTSQASGSSSLKSRSKLVDPQESETSQGLRSLLSNPRLFWQKRQKRKKRPFSWRRVGRQLQWQIRRVVDPIAYVALVYLIGLFLLVIALGILGVLILLYPAFFDTPLAAAIDSQITFWLETAPYTAWFHWLNVSIVAALGILAGRLALIPLFKLLE